jgi:hypothetical protein
VLAQQRHREGRDQQGGDEEQGIGLGERQLLECEREGREHRDREHAAQQVQRPAHLDQLSRPAGEQHPDHDERP